MAKIIGLTGGIGSGKSTVAKYFESLGVPVYIADDEAKKILQTVDTTEEVFSVFGNDVMDGNIINRKKLSEIVFNDADKLKVLNSIIHPKVKMHFEKWLEMHKNNQFVLKEAAVLFESGSYKNCDYIITVEAPLEIRIQRVIERDHSSREMVLSRIQNQLSEKERISKSDFVIQNISINETKRKVEEILKTLKNI